MTQFVLIVPLKEWSVSESRSKSEYGPSEGEKVDGMGWDVLSTCLKWKPSCFKKCFLVWSSCHINKLDQMEIFVLKDKRMKLSNM